MLLWEPVQLNLELFREVHVFRVVVVCSFLQIPRSSKIVAGFAHGQLKGGWQGLSYVNVLICGCVLRHGLCRTCQLVFAYVCVCACVYIYIHMCACTCRRRNSWIQVSREVNIHVHVHAS